jgi:hypothetical protein
MTLKLALLQCYCADLGLLRQRLSSNGVLGNYAKLLIDEGKLSNLVSKIIRPQEPIVSPVDRFFPPGSLIPTNFGHARGRVQPFRILI